jgi:hypothetical protein
MKSKTPLTDALRNEDNGDPTPVLELCAKLESSHSRLLAALKYLSNDEKGCFEGWENGKGVNIQNRLERPIKMAEKLCAPAESANADLRQDAGSAASNVK